MKRVLKVILKWIIRIILGALALIVLVLILFFLFKGKIKDRALDHVNDMQPGVVELQDIKLKLFRRFPDVSVQLDELTYVQGEESGGGRDTIPIFRMEKIYVSLDIIQLIKGNYMISEVSLGEGEINYHVYPDSVSNIELALGDLMAPSSVEEEVTDDSSSISLDLDKFEISGLRINYLDETENADISLLINLLESSFLYFDEVVTTELELDIDLDRARYDLVVLDKPRRVIFSSALIYDLLNNQVQLDRSMLDIQDAVIELSGNVHLLENPYMDLTFNAKNEGIELLNFILNGVLDMDAIEQIGSGKIEFGGEVRGELGDELPVVTAHFSASDLGFKVKTLNRSVTNIGFKGTATNGKLSDLSEASLALEDFHASFPEGEIDLEMEFSNIVSPVIDLTIDAGLDLAILNEFLKTDDVQEVSGKVALSGDIKGRINKKSGEFLDDSGKLTAEFAGVSFMIPDYHIERLNGLMNMTGRDMAFEDLGLEVNGNAMMLNLEIYNMVPYFMGFKTAPSLTLEYYADEIDPGKLLSDTALTNMFTEPFRNIGFNISANTSYDQFHKVIEGSSDIPQFSANISDLHIQIPGYDPISEVICNLEVGSEKLNISQFSGMIDQSSFMIETEVTNYKAYLEKDSLAPLEVKFLLASRLLRASDLLTYNDHLMFLPEAFGREEIKRFRFRGKLQTRVGELLKEGGIPDFRFTTEDINWEFKYYPLGFHNFTIDVEHVGNLIKVHALRGEIGENNFEVNGTVANLLDSASVISGKVNIRSDLLDLNELMDYDLLAAEDSGDQSEKDTIASSSSGLNEMDIPNFQLNVDIGELRYEENALYGLLGQVRSIPEKIIYLDKFRLQTETGGIIIMDGQLNLIDPDAYTLSATFDIDTLNLSDLKVEFPMEDTVYTLDQTFTGILDAQGIAEVYLLPDLNPDLSKTTASFKLSLKNGSVKNFTPLQAAGKFTGSKDLDNVKFGEIRNRFTLVDETFYIPQMSINSTLGQMVVEGEQGIIDGHYMYLVRIPPSLISGTAKNMITGQKESKGEDMIMESKAGKFVVLTVSDMGVKAGDRRDKFDEE